MIGQKKRHSIIEICIGTAIGYFVAIITQRIIFPLFDIQVSHSENFTIAGIFTVVSLVRGYFVRRLFNWLHIKNLL